MHLPPPIIFVCVRACVRACVSESVCDLEKEISWVILVGAFVKEMAYNPKLTATQSSFVLVPSSLWNDLEQIHFGIKKHLGWIDFDNLFVKYSKYY